MNQLLDHRQIADEMEIFVLDPEIGAGLPMWLPNGAAVRDALESYMRQLEHEEGYQRVYSPHIAKASLYERSGHLAQFSDEMFPPMDLVSGQEQMYLRPMNCPHHHKIFAAKARSYRDLPLRLAEYGQVYRFENSGALRGLSRVRSLCQNDAHLYCEPEQAAAEIRRVLNLHQRVYRDLRLSGYHFRLSLRNPDQPTNYQGSRADWQRAESLLRETLGLLGLPFVEALGEATFYGPKIDVQMPMLDSREESIASVQLDISSADNFDLVFRNREGKDVRPWIIHRAPLGSHERFIAMLLEKSQGQLPPWLAPVQVMILPLLGAGDENLTYAENLATQARQLGLRVQVDKSSGSLNKRLLFMRRLRPCFHVIVGDKERVSSKLLLKGRSGQAEIAGANWLVELKSRLIERNLL